HVVLQAILNGKTDEREERRVLWLHRPREKDRVGHLAILGHAALNQVDPEIDVAADLDRAAEGELTIALREVQITARELRAGHPYGIVDACTTREVFNIVVPAVLAAGHGAGALAGDLLRRCARGLAGEHALFQRR